MGRNTLAPERWARSLESLGSRSCRKRSCPVRQTGRIAAGEGPPVPRKESEMDPIQMLRSMRLIRALEAALLRHANHGFQLFSSGQEAVAVGVCAALRAEDQLLTSGRSIGP